MDAHWILAGIAERKDKKSKECSAGSGAINIRKFMKKFLPGILILFFLNALPIILTAQTPGTPSAGTEMADALRADGNIYVVVLVVVILFTFLLGYLLVTDRQVKKLEKEVKELKNTK